MLPSLQICPTKDFYRFVAGRGHFEAGVYNRMTIKSEGLDWPETSSEYTSFQTNHDAAASIMEQSQNIMWHEPQYTMKHPGYDCFVFNSKLLAKFNFGELFLGYPPWDGNLVLAMRIMASRVAIRQSNPQGTFHIGWERAWQKNNGDDAPVGYDFWHDDFTPEEIDFVKYCPVLCYPPPDRHILQLVINCGKWFKPRSVEDGGDGIVPSMVEPGHEEIYLNKYQRQLKEDIDFPGVWYAGKTKREATPMRKVEWIETFGTPKTDDEEVDGGIVPATIVVARE